jgi:beta-galactosidase/beta-glucuronidase
MDIPRPEHPRPDFMRQPWLNLNGRWRFTFDPHNVGEQRRWYRLPHPEVALAQGGDVPPLLLAASRQGEGGVAQPFVEDPFGLEITVPFPWESRLSGLSAKEYKGAAWYQRSLEVPSEWAQADTGDGPLRWRRRPYLCFGAVDWHARVWVNGRFAGEHSGGYTPFSLDIGRFVQPGGLATLTVRAYDACDADTLLGKQTYDWYTPSSGIWQTVWLEGRAGAHLSRRSWGRARRALPSL